MNSGNVHAIGGESILRRIEEEGLKNIQDHLHRLYFIWKEFGLDTEQTERRVSTVWAHSNSLFQDIVDEENALYEDVKERISNYKSKIEKLSVMLSMAVTADEDVSSIIKTEEALRKQLDTLNKLQHERCKRYTFLKDQELEHCRILGMPAHALSSTTGVPSESDIQEVGDHLGMLKKEREKRRHKLHIARMELTTILETTEASPETSLEKDVLSGREENITLTTDTFKAIQDVICKHQKKKIEMENRKKVLMDKLHVMWHRLKVEEEWKMGFLLKHGGCKISTLKSVEHELERLEKIKRENTKAFVETLRRELDELWTQCMIPETERALFHPYFSNQMSDSLLEAHEAEAEKWRKYQEQVSGIIQKIQDRNKLWDKMIEFEKKVADPDRLKNNRGGRLLKEERERKKFQKDLPALENEIFSNIRSYEEESGKSFLYFGEDYEGFVTHQWEERNSQKENVKLERHKRKLENEITLNTPGKRFLHTTATPKSAPSKLLKSTITMSIHRTPMTPMLNRPRVVPGSVGKLALSKGKLFSPVSRPKAIQKKDKDASRVVLGAVSSDSTTYDRFASLLNKTGKRNLRSSVLSCRKSGGTRISQTSHSKRKSANKSKVRKSARLTSLTTSSTLTPARGKLGLPFLI